MDLTWRAGAARAVLPVPAGTPLGGYGSRSTGSTGQLSPLEANVLALGAGSRTAVVVSLDLLAIDAAWVRALRSRVRLEHGIPDELVLVAASHTHAGPDGFRSVGATAPFDRRTRALRRLVLDEVGAAVTTALGRLRAATLRIGHDVCAVAAHRHDPAVAVDGQVTRVDVLGDDAEPLALVWHYACHATVLSDANTQVSPDLPGEVRTLLRGAEAEALPVVYLNGAAADVSTRFTRRDQSVEELRRLAAEVVSAMPSPERPLPPVVPSGRITRCALPVALEAPDVVSARLRVARRTYAEAGVDMNPARRRILETDMIGLEKRLARCRRSPRRPQGSRQAAVQLLDLGDLRLVGFPGELYAAQGLELRGRAGGPWVLPVGYAGDYLGYLPPAGGREGYEASSATVAAGAGDRLVEAAVDLVRESGTR